MSCPPGHVFDGTEGTESSFHILHSRTRFRWNRGRRVQFLSFALPDLISAVLRASGSIFKFCAPGPDFGGTKGVESSFHVSPSRTHFQWNRGRQVQFSYFALPDPFSAVPRASSLVFMSFPPVPIFDDTKGVRSSFLVLHSKTRFSVVPRASGLVFVFCVPGPIFGGTKVVGSSFHELRSQTRFRRHRGRSV
jgi:hypothetical protein